MKMILARLLLRLLAFLPLKLLRALAAILARLPLVLPRRRRRLLEDNLVRAFPDLDATDRTRLARANRIEMLRTAFEAAPLWMRSRAWVECRITAVEGRERIDCALVEGRGVLVLGGHLGQWELSILHGFVELPISFLYKPPRSDVADRLLTRYRTRFGGEMIATGGAGLRTALRRLRTGRAVGMLFDQMPRAGDSRTASFFAHQTATMTLPHRLVRATGCTVIMGHCLRTGDGWKIVFDEVPGGDDPDPAVALAAMNRALEQVIMRAPEQYLWHYRRFDSLSGKNG